MIRARLDAVLAALETLGPIVELDRRWRAAANVAEAKAVRARIQEVLDGPPCAYDDGRRSGRTRYVRRGSRSRSVRPSGSRVA